MLIVESAALDKTGDFVCLMGLRSPAMDLNLDLLCEFAAEVIDVYSGPAVNLGGIFACEQADSQGSYLRSDSTLNREVVGVEPTKVIL